MDDRPAGQRHAPSHQALLLALRRDGPLSPDRLAAEFHLSRTAVLQQLRTLASDGLVERRSLRHGVGRPRHLYDLTERAQPLLPASYDRLAVSLLGAVLEVGGAELVGRVFEARGTVQARVIRDRLEKRGLATAPLAERARELALIQSEQGLRLRAAGGRRTAPGGAQLSHPPGGQGRASRLRSRGSAFREALGVEVVRERHIAAGARCCEYRLLDTSCDLG